MRNLTKKILFFSAVFALMVFGAGVSAENEEVNDEATEEEIEEVRERIDDLSQKVHDLINHLEEELEKEEEAEEVVEEEEEGAYDPYLEEYIRYGTSGEEVEKLQTFLNEYLHEDLPVTGYYGDMTLELVNRFQMKHANEILEPWGITEPTGYVYKTTQRKINDIKNPDVTIPIPDVRAEEVAGDIDEMEEEIVERETIDDVEPEEVVDEEVDEEEEEREESNTLAWVVIILGAIGLGYVINRITKEGKPKVTMQDKQ